MYDERRKRVQKRMNESGIDQLLITNIMSIYYLSGEIVQPFERFWGLFLSKTGDSILIANRLFHITENHGCSILWYEDGQNVIKVLENLVNENAILGINQELSAKFLLPLIGKTEYQNIKIDTFCVDKVRAIKTDEEIRNMREAAKIVDKCAEKMPEFLQEGISEQELGDKIIHMLKDLGADQNSWGSPLIAFGKNSGDPHHCPDSTCLIKGDIVLADIGCKKNSYCADLTRTYFYGDVSKKQREIYRIVKKANERAEAAVRPGITFGELDEIARSVIREAGYEKYFNHRLGHSIGLEGHEGEEVSGNNKNRIEAGMTFSIEPGIYIPEEGGVRVEDVILVTNTGCDVLNRARKEE